MPKSYQKNQAKTMKKKKTKEGFEQLSVDKYAKILQLMTQIELFGSQESKEENKRK